MGFRIVAKVNAAIGEDENAEALIGVLDIYGFEDFQNNGCLSAMPAAPRPQNPKLLSGGGAVSSSCASTLPTRNSNSTSTW